MNLDSTMKTILVAVLLIISVPVTFLFWKIPATKLSAPEKELMKFTSQPLAMSPPRNQIVFSALDSPVRITPKNAAPVADTVPKGFPPGPIPAANAPATIAPAAEPKPIQPDSFGSHPVISMVYSEGSVKMAVIDGQVLHEGSLLGKHKVIKIEKTRVLMRIAGKDIWLNID